MNLFSSYTTLRILVNLVMFGLILIITKLDDSKYYEKGNNEKLYSKN